MFGEHLRAALRSLTRRPGLSAVMVAVLGVGVGIFTVALIGFDAEERIARPEYAGVYRVLLDRPSVARAPEMPWLFNHVADVLLTREEAESLRALGDRVVATYGTTLPVRAGEAGVRLRSVRVTTRPLFEVFGRRFVDGEPWPASGDDAAAAPALVVTDAVAREWFGSDHAAGRIVDVDGVAFPIVGVVARADARPYDIRFTAEGDELFVPWAQGAALGLASDLALPGAGFVNVSAAGDVGRLRGAARLVPCSEFWRRSRMRDPGMFVSGVLALVALGGCTLNFARLLLAKFMAHTATASIRRALGARRTDVFVLHLFEALLVAAPASLLGLAIGWAGGHAFNAALPFKPAVYQFDVRLVLASVGVTHVAALVAGVWPAALVSRVPPATQLRNV